MRSVAFRVTGRVQGVGYRAATARLAARLGVAGWVRNVSDGAVEGRAAGPDDAVDAFIAGLATAAGHPRDVATRPVPPSGGPGFEVRGSVPAPTTDWPS